MKSTAMLYPIIDIEKWAKMYALPIKSSECDNCGKILTANIPFATGNWRGFISKEHECGEEFDLFVAANADKNERKFMKDSFNALKYGLTNSTL